MLDPPDGSSNISQIQTTLAAAILVFKKHKPDTSVVFIDASQEYEDGTNQNHLRAEDLDKIVATYKARKSVSKYAHVADLTEICENDFNLNIPLCGHVRGGGANRHRGRAEGDRRPERGVGPIREENGRIPEGVGAVTKANDTPTDWLEADIGSLTEKGRGVCYGVVQPGEHDSGGVRLVRGGDIRDGKVSRDLRTVSQEVSDQYSRTLLRGGEVLVCLVGYYVGETAIAPPELAGANLARQVAL